MQEREAVGQFNEKYVVTETCGRVGDIAEHKKTRPEKLESIRAYDEAKASNDESVPLRQALAEIERERE
jgi:hypothetical protein